MNNKFKNNLRITISGIIFILIVSGILLRLFGFKLTTFQHNTTLKKHFDKKDITIMCLGESITAGFFSNKGYPDFLEEKLKSMNETHSFKVYNLGTPSTQSSSYLIEELNKNIEKYKPDIIVAMMGVTDHQYGVEEDAIKPLEKIEILKKGYIETNVKRDVAQANTPSLPFRDIGDNLYNRLHSEDYIAPRVIAKAKENNFLYEKYLNLFKIDNSILNETLAFYEDFIKKETDRKKNKLLLAYSYSILGERFFNLKNTEKAKYCYEKAIAFYPEQYGFYHTMLHKTLSYKQLEDLLSETIHKYNNAPWTYANLGKFYFEAGLFGEKAASSFKKAIDLGSQDVSAYVCLAFTYGVLSIGDHDYEKIKKAEDLFSKSLIMDPNFIFIYYKMKTFYDVQADSGVKYDMGMNKEKMWKKRLDVLLKLMAFAKEDGDLHFDLARLYEENYDDLNAEKNYIAALELRKKRNQDTIGVTRRLALLYHKQKNSERYEYFKKMLDKVGYYSEITRESYRRLKDTTDKYNIKLVAMQYPLRNINIIKRFFKDNEQEEILFVENQENFIKVLQEGAYSDYFADSCHGDFGHTKNSGSEIIAENVANMISTKILGFNKLMADGK